MMGLIERHERSGDKFLRWMVIIGPILGFMFGNCAGAVITYQAFKNLDGKVSLLVDWSEKQNEFNLETVKAIARLKALIKDD